MAYTIGKKLTDDGVWLVYSGAKLKIGRAGSTEWLKAQEDLERPFKKRIEKGTLSATIKRDINIRNVARTILLDWDGVQDEDGKKVAYTEEIGFTALQDDPDLLEFVLDSALDNDNFRVKENEKVAKKSQNLSSGK
jgi:hypothetical protein